MTNHRDRTAVSTGRPINAIADRAVPLHISCNDINPLQCIQNRAELMHKVRYLATDVVKCGPLIALTAPACVLQQI